jgi:hypothetical protein
MKIIAQSTLADGNPYIHLGYLSSTAIEKHMTPSTGGIVSLILGAAIVATAVVARLAAGVAPFRLIRRFWIFLSAGGCACMVLGGIALYLSPVQTREYYLNPEIVTMTRAEAIQDEIKQRRDSGQAVPNDLSGLGIEQRRLTDGWWHPFRYVIDGEEGSRTYTLISAGPDGVFDTADDLRYSAEPLWKERERYAVLRLKRFAEKAVTFASAGDNLFPAQISELVDSSGRPRGLAASLNDPRLSVPPVPRDRMTNANTRKAPGEGDFSYAGAGVRLNDVPQQASFILLYDHPNAGPNRLIAFADGHVESIPPGSPQIERLVVESNKQRQALKLPALPAGLSAPPVAVP